MAGRTRLPWGHDAQTPPNEGRILDGKKVYKRSSLLPDSPSKEAVGWPRPQPSQASLYSLHYALVVNTMPMAKPTATSLSPRFLSRKLMGNSLKNSGRTDSHMDDSEYSRRARLLIALVNDLKALG